MDEREYQADGWRPSWKPPAMGTEHLASLPDRDDLAYDPHPLVFGPVETTNGEAMRQAGMRVLMTKVETLRARQAVQRLTVPEQRDLMDAQAAIHTLIRMAPVGELLPPRASDLA